MVLLTPTMQDGSLTLATRAKVVGAVYVFELRFEAALPSMNCYSLRVETSWAEHAATHQDYFLKTSESWFRLWTRDFAPADPPRAEEGSVTRYAKLCEAALKSEQHLDTIPAIQNAILAALKQGARFTTSHKEGGTNISWNGRCFVRADYGEDPDSQAFASESAFLAALRQFYDWEVSKSIYPDKASDFVAWKLILRLLRMP